MYMHLIENKKQGMNDMIPLSSQQMSSPFS
jgi:hypothetical protein